MIGGGRSSPACAEGRRDLAPVIETVAVELNEKIFDPIAELCTIAARIVDPSLELSCIELIEIQRPALLDSIDGSSKFVKVQMMIEVT